MEIKCLIFKLSNSGSQTTIQGEDRFLKQLADATEAMLFPGMADVGSQLTAAKRGSVLTVTPLAGQVENTAQSVTVKATDALGNRLATSTALSFSFDSVTAVNKAPVFASATLEATGTEDTVLKAAVKATDADTGTSSRIRSRRRERMARRRLIPARAHTSTPLRRTLTGLTVLW